jgi:hypothetical protein
VLLLVTIVAAAAVLAGVCLALAEAVSLNPVFVSRVLVLPLSFAIWMPFLVVLLAVIYYDLLQAKEGEIAVIFD